MKKGIQNVECRILNVECRSKKYEKDTIYTYSINNHNFL